MRTYRHPRHLVTACLILTAGLLAACTTSQAAPPALSPTPVIYPDVTPSVSRMTAAPDPTATATLLPEPTPYPCGPQVCILPGHFVLSLPISADYTQVIEPSYPYGSTQNGKREPHHGVEFINPAGTPVLSALDGSVIFAGTDANSHLGAMPFYYGNVVVIEHRLPGMDQPVYTLYGHLSKVLVAAGETVKTGAVIGEVGRTGKAIGSHLHFEVRAGLNDYNHTRNPELWLNAAPGSGMLTGRMFNQNGEVRRYPELTITSINDPGRVIPRPVPYAPSTVNGDDIYGEIFASIPLPPGQYELAFSPGRDTVIVPFEIIAGAVTRITLTTEN